MRSSRHDLYKLGYSCVTRVFTKRSEKEIWSKSFKNYLSSNCRLKLALHEDGIVSNRRSARYGE